MNWKEDILTGSADILVILPSVHIPLTTKYSFMDI